MFDNSSQRATSSSQAIADWRASIAEFFSGEWDELRKIVLNLEEASWHNDGVASELDSVDSGPLVKPADLPVSDLPVADAPGSHAPPQESAAGTRTDFDALGSTGSRTVAEPTSDASPAHNRLADLARQIEERLKAADSQTESTEGLTK